MNIYYTELFSAKVRVLPVEIKKALKTKLELMVENPRHPSLWTKRIQGHEGIFEAIERTKEGAGRPPSTLHGSKLQTKLQSNGRGADLCGSNWTHV